MENTMFSSKNHFQKASVSTSFVAVFSVTSGLSILGAIFIFLTYFTWKEIRTSSRRILVYISIADFFTALGNLFSVLHKEEGITLCKVQSFVTTTSSLWSFFWTTFMAVFLFFTVARRQPALAEKLLCGFHIFAWGVPIIIVGTALNQGVLGDDKDHFTAGWCWIRKMETDERDRQLMWMWFTGKGWEIATYILIIIFYGALKWHIHRDINYRHQQFTTIIARQAAIKADRKLTWVPLVFILCRIWGTIRFLLDVVNMSEKSNGMRWLLYLQGIGDSAQGFANFMLFCFFTEKFQKKFRQVCCRCVKTPPPLSQSSYDSPHNEARPRTPINEHTALLSSLKE